MKTRYRYLATFGWTYHGMDEPKHCTIEHVWDGNDWRWTDQELDDNVNFALDRFQKDEQAHLISVVEETITPVLRRGTLPAPDSEGVREV